MDLIPWRKASFYFTPKSNRYGCLLSRRFLMKKFHSPKKALCWMCLCLATASTNRGNLLRGRKTHSDLSVSLSGPIYKVDITGERM